MSAFGGWVLAFSFSLTVNNIATAVVMIFALLRCKNPANGRQTNLNMKPQSRQRFLQTAKHSNNFKQHSNGEAFKQRSTQTTLNS